MRSCGTVVIFAVAALAAVAAACDVCSGLSVHEEPVTEIVLPSTGDLSSCACAFLFVYSGGPTPGKVTLSATPGAGAITVYGDAAGTEVIAELPDASVVDGVVIHSRTGTIRVDVTTVASPPPSSSITLSSTAVNTAPVIEQREDIDLSFLLGVQIPWTPEGDPLPVTVRDYDNNDLGLRVEIELEIELAIHGPTLAISIPPAPGVVFEEGAPNTLSRRVVVSGPGSAVEAAVNNGRLIPVDMGGFFTELLHVRASDLGNSGEGGTLGTAYEIDAGVYAVGVVDIPRGESLLTGGYIPPDYGTDALYLVHDAFRMEFFRLDIPPVDGGCPQYVRVWDGTDIETARLLSTDVSLSGEICGESNELLPTYEGTTGEFVVEFHSFGGLQSNFDTIVSATPVGFRAWLPVDDDGFEVTAGGRPVLLPQFMVTSLPDPSDIQVNITTTAGTLSLRFADSFVDLVVASDDRKLALALTEADGVPAMLRMGDVLREVEFSMARTGSAVVRVEATSRGFVAQPLEFIVESVAVAINAPATLAINAFQPVPLGVSVDANGLVVVEVIVEGGLGQVSMDPRAAIWVDIGYGRNVTATGTAAEVNFALESLVYKATEGGGIEPILVRVGSLERTIEVTVDPDCRGSHFVYGREGAITERAGPPTDRHGPDVECIWFINGPREMRFPLFELQLPQLFIVEDAGDDRLFVLVFQDPGVLRASPLPYFEAYIQGAGVTSQGFVGVFQRSASINDPPVLVVPIGLVRVLRGSTTRLRTLYIDDFGEGVIEASLETDAGSLQEEGNRRVEIVAATFEELDAWVTGIDFIAGDVQTTATLTLTAIDDGGAESVAEFQIEVLSCSGTAEVTVGDGSESVVFGDGSETADYVDALSCGWRLTGAPGPAALQVALLDLDCGGDAVTVYDGSSTAGRVLGSFCQADDVAAEVGTLVSSTGSFFVSLLSDGDGLVGDGFSFEYGAVAAGTATDLGVAPRTADPDREDAAVIALGGGSVAVFGGHNGVRAVSTTLVFVVGDGWRTVAGRGPTARSRAAGAALSASRIVVHGGVDIDGTVVADTWVGDIAGDAIAWTQLPSSGPETALAAMHVHDGAAHLVDASGVWILDGDDNTWTEIGDTPETVVATSSAYRRTDGLVYATGTDGAVWSLSLMTGAWTPLGVEVDVECAPWACSGAMLGPDEYVVGGLRVNVTSLAVSALPAPSVGQTVGGVYLGQPSLLVYSSGAMTAVPLTLGVSSHGPVVSPDSGGTTVTLVGEQLSTCGDPVCEFGFGRAPAAVVTERSATCVTPGGATTVSVALSCEDGRRYTSPDPLVYFGEPTIASVEPATPDPGDTVLIVLDGVSDETLALVDAPLCRFDGASTSAIFIDHAIECRVPETALRGATVTLEVSLDGQQFGSGTSVPLSSSSSSSFPILVVAFVSATVLLILGAVIARYRRLANSRVLSMGPAAWEIPFDSLELLDVIGIGAYGAVHRGRYRGGEVAIKVIKDADSSDDNILAFRKESALMSELRHPNIVLFMGACTMPPDIAIVLEFLPNGSLFDLLQDDHVRIGQKERLSFALDIVKGMAYLHGADPPIIHRDLKSLNVLVDKSWNLKVSDFGLTEIFNAGGGGAPKLDEAGDPTSAPGSMHWQAPEVLLGEVGDTSSDVYSFGVTLWEICTREGPYHGMPFVQVLARVTGEEALRPSAGGETGPPPFDAIIEECWATDPAARPSFLSLRMRLEEMRTSNDEMTEMTPSLGGSSMVLPSLELSCAVVIRAVDTADLWEADPMRMRELLEQFRTDVESLCYDHKGEVSWEPEAALCAFVNVSGGAAFATSVQGRPWADGLSGGLSVAGGLGVGQVRLRTDPVSRQTSLQGSCVEDARQLARESVGGQILARRGALDDVDTEAIGVAVLEADADKVGLYLFALKDRHSRIVVKSAETATDPSWVIKSDDLEIGTLIGAGSFGTVYKAEWKGTMVAAKQLHRKKLGAKEALDLRMEGGMASKLRHPNVCLVVGVCRDTKAGKVYVVSEYMSKGSVFEAIVTAKKPIAGKIKYKVAKGLALGLRYLHEQDPVVVHRSLTSRNVLLGDGWTAKVSDFGLARVKDSAASMTKIESTAYSAPEVAQAEHYDEKADVYAFGIVVWETVAQQVAWGGVRMGAVLEAVVEGRRPPVKDEWRTKGDGLERLVEVLEKCWKGEANERPGMGEVGRMLEG